LPDTFKVALSTAAREVSAALRQHILVSDGKAIEAFRSQGVEVTSLDAADIAEARKKAIDVWRQATKGDKLATEMVDSQVAFMQHLALLTPPCPQPLLTLTRTASAFAATVSSRCAPPRPAHAESHPPVHPCHHQAEPVSVHRCRRADGGHRARHDVRGDQPLRVQRPHGVGHGTRRSSIWPLLPAGRALFAAPGWPRQPRSVSPAAATTNPTHHGRLPP